MQPKNNDRFILLVEDNDINQAVAREVLYNAGLINVDVCDNGNKAVLAVQNKDYSLVLMDIQMPIMDGFEATKNIRKLASQFPQLRQLPIIAMTSHTSANDVDMCLSAGMNSHLSKPINPEAFCQKVKHYIDLNEKIKTIDNNDYLMRLPGIDIQDGLSRLQGNWPLYRQLLISFKVKHFVSDATLEAQISTEQWDSARKLSHIIKGSSGNLGAKELHDHSSKLEDFCIEENQAKALEQLNEVSSALKTIINSLQQVQDETQENNDARKRDVKQSADQKQAAKYYLEQLLDYFDTDLNKADKCLSKAQVNISLQHENDINEIKKYLHLFDIDAAKQATKKLIVNIK